MGHHYIGPVCFLMEKLFFGFEVSEERMSKKAICLYIKKKGGHLSDLFILKKIFYYYYYFLW